MESVVLGGGAGPRLPAEKLFLAWSGGRKCLKCEGNPGREVVRKLFQRAEVQRKRRLTFQGEDEMGRMVNPERR